MGKRLATLDSRRAETMRLPTRPSSWQAPTQLSDRQSRKYHYLRISVTDRCDLACHYCMPAGGEDEHGRRNDLLSFEEIERLATIYASVGIRRVRLTGGEPLIRRDLVNLVQKLSNISQIEEVLMTTNATQLSRLAKPLADAGLSAVNISLDTLTATRFHSITQKDRFDDVMRGIDAALNAGIKVKINTVAMRGINDDEFEALVRFAWSKSITPRFIEKMPLGGENAQKEHITAAEIWTKLQPLVTGDDNFDSFRGPARYKMSLDGKHQVGVISALSKEFCDSCNRFRISAQGELRACLASRRAVHLRDQLRSGASNEDILWATHWALQSKEIGHFFNDENRDEHLHVGMSLIGG